jgi:amidase
VTADLPGAGTVPPDLLAAFVAYEAALAADDLDQLDSAFAPGPGTLRGDAAGLLVGHDAISAFRSTRGGVPPRVIERVEHRELAPDVALLVSVSRYAGGGTGLQTQVWERVDGTWRITAAHVTPRAQAFDRSVWRTVGDPLHQGAQDGPLTGLTVAVKDVFALSGHPVGAGNPAWLASAHPETSTAPAVRDLLRGGASVRGIARTDEFAYSIAGDSVHYGTPPNGALPGALPGGSSSGPASAVATGQADVGLGTDTAGSVRVPASYQGLWGLRTTHDLVPRQGMLPLAQSFDAVGWLTRDGDTLQGVAEWCLGSDGSESARRVLAEDLPWRLLVPVEVLDDVEPATRAAFEVFLVALAALPDAPDVDQVSIGPLEDYLAAFRTVQGAEAWRNDGPWLREHPSSVGPAVAARFRAAAAVTGEDEAAARGALAPLAARLEHLVADAVLVLPTVPGPAPARSGDAAAVDAVRAATLRMTTPAAVAGLPALSVPLLTVPSSLGPAPVGVCAVSCRGSDLALVRLGRRLARAAAAADVAPVSGGSPA